MHDGGMEGWVVSLNFWGGLQTTRLCAGWPGGLPHYTGSAANKKPIRTEQEGPETIKCKSQIMNTMSTDKANSDNPNFPTWKFGQSEFSNMKIRTIRIFSIAH